MILRHVTPAEYLPSIAGIGLTPEHARTKIRAIWLHTVRHTEWAIRHVAKHHGKPPEEMVVLTASVGRGELRRLGPGIWLCYAPIPPFNLGYLGDDYAEAVIGGHVRPSNADRWQTRWLPVSALPC